MAKKRRRVSRGKGTPKTRSARDIGPARVVRAECPPELLSCYENSWAVVVGINSYKKMPSLECAVPDAEEVVSAVSDLGFPEDHVFQLTNAEATKQNIQDVMCDEVARKAGPNDRLLVFYAGHGQDFTAPTGRKLGYLIPIDGDPKRLASRCISMDDIDRWGELIPAKHILYVIDCCYSGLAATRSAGLDPQHANYVEEITRRPVRQIITAGRGDQRAVEEAGHGIFTRLFVDGIKGAADLRGRGFVTGFDLGHYLELRVFEESRGRQQPMFRYLRGDGEFVVVCPAKREGDAARPAVRRRPATSAPKVVVPASPLPAALDLSEIEASVLEEERTRERERGKREACLARIRWDFARVEEFCRRDIGDAHKAEAWRRFLEAYEESPLVTDEETNLRREAEGNLAYFLSPSPTLTLDLGGDIAMELVLIPPGEFMMGSPDSEIEREGDEGPQHRVRITRPFYMGKYEVTQAQYERVMGTNRSRFKASDEPVEMVSWNDAVDFCRMLSQRTGRKVRLPTEAEWEYACRAGTTTPFHFGESLSSDQANFDGNRPYGGAAEGAYREKTTSVGSFPANAWGLHDMHGNVWEWCCDCYDKGYCGKSPLQNPRGPTSGSYRVLRGGSWSDYGFICRSAYRYRNAPTLRFGNIGSRVAVAAPGQ